MIWKLLRWLSILSKDISAKHKVPALILDSAAVVRVFLVDLSPYVNSLGNAKPTFSLTSTDRSITRHSLVQYIRAWIEHESTGQIIDLSLRKRTSLRVLMQTYRCLSLPAWRASHFILCKHELYPPSIWRRSHLHGWLAILGSSYMVDWCMSSSGTGVGRPIDILAL